MTWADGSGAREAICATYRASRQVSQSEGRAMESRCELADARVVLRCCGVKARVWGAGSSPLRLARLADAHLRARSVAEFPFGRSSIVQPGNSALPLPSNVEYAFRSQQEGWPRQTQFQARWVARRSRSSPLRWLTLAASAPGAGAKPSRADLQPRSTPPSSPFLPASAHAPANLPLHPAPPQAPHSTIHPPPLLSVPRPAPCPLVFPSFPS